MFSLPQHTSRFLVVLFNLILTTSIAYAQKTSTGSGDWNNAATWTPSGVPGISDDVTISAGHTITMTADGTCRKIFLDGELDMSGGSNIMITTTNQSQAGATNGIQLGAGSVLTIGADNVVYFSNGQASGIVNNGGTITSTGTNGEDGGTIRTNTCCGGQFRFSGTGSTTIYNMEFLNNANFQVNADLTINGQLTIPNNNWNSSSSTQSPVWGAASTLYIDRNNQGISPAGGSPVNNNLNKMWAVTTGTIGVTPGYPNNVTIVDIGQSSGQVNLPPNTGMGWRPNVAVGLHGTLQIGDANSSGTTTARVSFDQATSVSVGGIIVDDGSIFVGAPNGISFTNSGDFVNQNGSFYPYGGTIDFNGTGTSGAPQIISSTSGSIDFSGITVSNGTYLQLQSDVTTNDVVTLSDGIIETSTSSTLTLDNTSTGAISGGSTTSYINGPLSWNLPATSSDNFTFPVGSSLNGGAYLPMTLNPNSSTITTATIQAFNEASGGIPDASVTTLSSSEYWSYSTTTAFSDGASVDVTMSAAVAPNNALASSSTQGGFYSAIGGIASGNTLSGGNVGTSTPLYIALAVAPLSVVKVSSVNITCPGTLGALTAGGSGGTPPYSFSIDGGSFNAVSLPNTTYTFSNLSAGEHTVTIEDNDGTTATETMYVLGSLQINGGVATVEVCPGETADLTAVNLVNSNPTYAWSTSSTGTPVVSTSDTYTTPAINSTQTFYAFSELYEDNLITNGSFESGATGFTSSYNNWNGQPQYVTSPSGTGYYKTTNASSNLCEFCTINGASGGPTLAAQDGTEYFMGDGATTASTVWETTVSGLTIGLTYRFSYYYANASTAGNEAILQTTIAGSNMGSVTATNTSAWTQVEYSWTATATSATINITNTRVAGTTGNDFAIDNIQFLEPCAVMDSIVVDPSCPPTCDITVDSDPSAVSICEGEDVSFSITASGTGIIYQWQENSSGSFANIAGENSSTLSFPPAISDAADYRMVLTDGATCGDTSSAATLTVNSIPTAEAGTDSTHEGAATVSLEGTGSTTSGVTYSWSSSPVVAITNSTSLTTTADITLTTEFFLTVDNGSCTATDSVTHTINYDIDIPSAFSPNGDGINDTWEIDNIGAFTSASIAIYNRWGSEIYRSEGIYNNDWDGTHNGIEYPDAVYYYVVDFGDGSEPVNGTISILR